MSDDMTDMLDNIFLKAFVFYIKVSLSEPTCIGKIHTMRKILALRIHPE